MAPKPPPSSAAETPVKKNSNEQSIYRTPPKQPESSGSHLPPAISAIPTSETWDESSTLRAPRLAQTPAKYRSPYLERPKHMRSVSVATDHTSNLSPTPLKSNISTACPTNSSSRKVPPLNTSHKCRRRRRRRNPDVEFQHVEDLMQLHVQAVNLAQRSAFGETLPLSIQEWKAAVSNKKRVSPSLPYLQLLHQLQQQTIIRQVQFSPSVFIDCDPWHQQETEAPRCRRRDGRYRAIDTLPDAELSSISSPVLSHPKNRLPDRADVGFPRATPEEIQRKRDELRNETAWEEHSPRLVVLLAAGAVGATMMEDESFPWAGRDFHRQLKSTPSTTTTSTRCNPYSMLAPPLESFYSSSRGWRPRAIQDRPVGRQYCCICPIQVEWKERQQNSEPLIGCLALYRLGTANAVGKISEDFWFPIGDWSEMDMARVLHPRTKQSSSACSTNESVELHDVLSQQQPNAIRKQKAIFSYTSGDTGLHVVLHVYQRWTTTGDVATMRTLLALGVAPVLVQNEWPRGNIGELQLCTTLETDSMSLLQRLQRLVQGDTAGISDSPESQQQGTASVADDTTSQVTTESGRSRSMVGRIFRSPMKRSTVSTSTGSVSTMPKSVLGHCTFFQSSLGTDFLSAMLSDAPEILVSPNEPTSGTDLPKLFVDMSGDFAVTMNSSSLFTESSKKRSSLERLARCPEPAGYAVLAEFREVLYLPLRTGKHYDYDSALSPRSVQNALFLYPRQVKLVSGDPTRHRLTVRIRAVRLDSDGINASVKLRSFHTSEPWVAGSLVDEVFTSVPSVVGGGESLVLHDEFKMRLPLLLDGTFSILVSLFDVSGGKLQLIAEATVPLSSITSLATGGRTAAVIPNGNHKVKLAEYELKLETRLVSSLHIGDPTLSRIYRNFPYADQEQPSAQLTAKLFVDETALVDTSGSLILGHFHALMFMHLWNLVRPVPEEVPTADVTSFLIGNVRSMFSILQKAKHQLLLDGGDSAVCMFVKTTMDIFDESFFSARGRDPDSVDTASDDNLKTSSSQDEASGDLAEEEPENDTGSMRLGRKSSKKLDRRVSRIVEALGNNSQQDAPFSRVAYGASKLDRMRLEAELQYDNGDYVSPFFDDDETVMTLPSMYTESKRSDMSFNPLSKSRDRRSFNDDANSILKTATATSNDTKKQPAASDPHREFANRVRTVAQVMLAPCVGPTLSNILSGKSSNARSTHLDEPATEDLWEETTDESKEGIEVSLGSEEIAPVEEPPLFPEGSDIDDTPASELLRGHFDGPLFAFSVKFERDNEVPVRCGEFIYESVVILWLRAWLDHVEARLRDQDRNPTETVATFPIPKYDPKSYSSESVFSFYAHMDFLLPLCLKSFAVRYSIEVAPSYPIATRAMLDDGHMLIMEPFVELLARGLVGQALSGLGSADGRDEGLARALQTSITVVEFLVGLMTILHGEQMHVLLNKFFLTLRDCETEHLGNFLADGGEFSWTEESLHRVRCCRQLRLRAIEMISSVPSFITLNYPKKYPSGVRPPKLPSVSWLHQSHVQGDTGGDPKRDSGNQKLPRSGWLADLLTGEGLLVCSLSCEVVIAEAMAHAEVSRTDVHATPQSKASALRKRPGAALRRDDLLMFQSMGLHAITTVYEVILRRHALDQRYQTESTRARVASLFTKAILEKSLNSVRWLARMESTHKIRSIWLLCFVYILQESPEPLLRQFLRSYCDPKVCPIITVKLA